MKAPVRPRWHLTGSHSRIGHACHAKHASPFISAVFSAAVLLLTCCFPTCSFGQSAIISHLALYDAGSRAPTSGFNPLLSNQAVSPLLVSNATIRAVLSSLPGSVRLSLTGPISFNRIDNTSPFTLFGDTSTAWVGQSLPSGSYSITVSAFSGPDGSGTLVESRTIPFSVSASATPTPSPLPTVTPTGPTPTPAITITPGQSIISHLGIINPSTGSSFTGFNPLVTGAVLPGTRPSSLSIRAFLLVAAPSVRLSLTGPITRTQIENGSPYSLFGESGSQFLGGNFPAGNYTITAEVFTNPNATGAIIDRRTITFSAAPTSTPSTVNPQAELLITTPSVVDDATRTQNRCDPNSVPAGTLAPWNFARLLGNMAGQNDPSSFIEHWLTSFGTAHTVNGDPVPARPKASIIVDAWPRLSNGKLDMARPPFRLLAIAYRPDLRSRTKGQAGEGRYVFGALDANCQALDFTVILEYKLLATDCVDTVEWAARFHQLGTLVGTSQYNGALQAITDRYSRAGGLVGGQNGNAINQVRTGERALGTDGIWEIREYKLLPTSLGTGFSSLELVTVKQTPPDSLNGSTQLADFINTNTTAILNKQHGVPDTMLGGRSRVLSPWAAPGILNPEARHLFGVATCNGCHSHETGTNLMHIRPRQRGAASALSDFLTGRNMPKVDPVDSTRSHTFSDLSRRGTDLGNLLTTQCTVGTPIPPAPTRSRFMIPVSRPIRRSKPRSLGAILRVEKKDTLFGGSSGSRLRKTLRLARVGSDDQYCDPNQPNNPRGRYRGSALRNPSPFAGMRPMWREPEPVPRSAHHQCVPPFTRAH